MISLGVGKPLTTARALSAIVWSIFAIPVVVLKPMWGDEHVGQVKERMITVRHEAQEGKGLRYFSGPIYDGNWLKDLSSICFLYVNVYYTNHTFLMFFHLLQIHSEKRPG